MPNLNDMVKERNNKKFIKRNYRPWDLTGESVTPALEETKIEPQSNPVKIIDTASKETLVIEQNLPTILSTKLGNKLDIQKETIEHQLDNNQISIGNQIDNYKTTEQITNGYQIDIALDPTSLYHQIMKLSGIQKNILDFIIDFCTFRHSLETGPIETQVLSTHAKTSPGVTKISIKRLIDKGFIIRQKGKQAKGGYINLSLTSEIYNAVIEQRKKFNNVCNPSDFINSIRHQLDNKELYNSSSIYNKNITTNNQGVLPKEWMEVNFESLIDIGFGKTQLKQLVGKNEPSIVQESIDHFAYGLEYNPKFKKYEDPLNVLMGVLRKHEGWFEKGYRSPKEIAQQKLLEIKKAEMERKKEMEDDAYKLAFQNWQQALTTDELENIAPAKKTSGQIMPQSAKLSLHFKDKVWPTLKTEYLIL